MLRLRPPLLPTHVWLKSACNFTVGPARMWFLCIHGSASLDSINLRVVWNHAPAKLLQSCPTVRPHKWKPTKLPCPWDSPGKNTGVGCHFLPQCMKVKRESEVAQSCQTLSNPMDCSLPGSSIHGIFQAGVLVGCHCLLRQEMSELQLFVESEVGWFQPQKV